MNGGTARGGALSDSGEPSTSGATLISSFSWCSGCPLHRTLRSLIGNKPSSLCLWLDVGQALQAR